MKRCELDQVFTAKVAEFLNNGYRIYTNYMKYAKFDGEIAKVDFIKEDEAYRLYMREYDEYYGNFSSIASIEIVTIRFADDKIFRSRKNSEFEVVDCRKFYNVAIDVFGRKKWYVEDLEEAISCCDKKWERYSVHHQQHETEKTLQSKKGIKILKKIRSIRGFKSAKWSDLSIVVHPNNIAKNRYTISCFGKTVLCV